MSKRLFLYLTFHLNLAYSSIEEEQRPEVIKHCYWPLLRLAREYNLPFGVEASAYTLEAASAIDPAWLEELRWLTDEGPGEFIGSGYAQIIGPLVPAEVNAANLRLGHQAYERLLGRRPHIALVNEQAYSSGLIQHYLKANYQAIIMEWDNPASCHPEWNPNWRYLPQMACDQHSRQIPVIWNKSMAFQKFQRYAHGEMEMEEYLDYLYRHLADEPRAFSIYGNDVEIFDFRPGRYHTEASLLEEVEWLRVGRLFKELLSDGRFQFIRPSQVLDLIQSPEAGKRLHLESPQQPILVKKQGKYNITRWAVTGRDDLGINTACWRIYEQLKADPAADDNDWRELCYLWSSDFRTHITEKRWAEYRQRLEWFEQRVARHIPLPGGQKQGITAHPKVNRLGRYLVVETDAALLRLNTQRGMAFDGLWFKTISDQPLVGTLPHGYYDDINLGADFYTGHLILASPGQPKVTDLSPVLEPVIEYNNSGVAISGLVQTRLGPVYKRIRVFTAAPCIEIEYRPEWKLSLAGSLRLGHVTINPAAFERDTLFYRTHNGGCDWEIFRLDGTAFDHGQPVSFLVSASHGLGLSCGLVEVGDRHRSIRVEVDKATAALIGLISFRRVGGDTYFCRLSLSATEIDETGGRISPSVYKLRISLNSYHSVPTTISFI